MPNTVQIRYSLIETIDSVRRAVDFSPELQNGFTDATFVANEKIERIYTIGTSPTAIDFTGVTSPAFVIITNLDNTNTITYGPNVPSLGGSYMEPLGTIYPRTTFPIPLEPGVILMLQASPSNTQVNIRVRGR